MLRNNILNINNLLPIWRMLLIVSLWCFISPMVNAEISTVEVQTMPISKGQLKDIYTAYGKLENNTKEKQSVFSPYSSIVDRVWVNIGQRVTKGQKLVKLRASPEAISSFQQANNRVKYDRLQLEHIKSLFEQRLATNLDLESAEKQLEDSNISLDAARARRQDRSSIILTADVEGVILETNVSNGQRISSDVLILSIAPFNSMVAKVGVEQEDLKRLMRSNTAKFYPVFDATNVVESSIQEIHRTLNPRTHMIDVLLSVSAEKARDIVSGSQVVAKFEYNSPISLIVPRSSVLRDSNGFYIFTIEQNIAKKKYVNKIVEQGQQIAITADVKVGDMVTTVGNYVLKSGMTVRVIH